MDSVVGALLYREPVRLLVGRAKFHGDLAHAALLGELLARVLSRRPLGDGPSVDCVLPVPLGRRRLRERGFNQAAEIARIVAGHQDLDLLVDGARRVKETVQQSALADRQARVRNLRGAFAVEGELVAGRRVAIIDDVVTTGATSYALAQTLRVRGATGVEVWCAARAELTQRG